MVQDWDLRSGDRISVNDLLYGLLMKSGNDAAVALAEHVGGDVPGFANLMNKKAEELGLKNTHFVTPHGLDNGEHYTTAYELAKLTDYAMQNKKFAEIVGTKIATITINGYSKTLNNTNELLGVLNGVVGVKTGFTNNAGRCLVTETKRNNMDLITIVLGADTKKDRTRDSVKLIEYAFANYKMINIQEKIIEEFNNWRAININRIEIIKGKQNNLEATLGEIKLTQIPLKAEDIDKIQYEINCINTVEAPMEKWTKIGMITVKLDGEIIETVDIIDTVKVEKKEWMDYFVENLREIQSFVEEII